MSTTARWIDLVWCDLLGRPRTVRVAPATLRERHTVAVAEVTAGFGGPGQGDGELLLVPDEAGLTPEAQKRLKALMEFTELGSGYKIALHDLQIRGGGNILGQAQSGHLAEVGYELYLQLLEQAIGEVEKGV